MSSEKKISKVSLIPIHTISSWSKNSSVSADEWMWRRVRTCFHSSAIKCVLETDLTTRSLEQNSQQSRARVTESKQALSPLKYMTAKITLKMMGGKISNIWHVEFWECINVSRKMWFCFRIINNGIILATWSVCEQLRLIQITLETCVLVKCMHLQGGGDLTLTVTKFYRFVCVCVYVCMHAFIYLFVLRPVSFCNFGGFGTHCAAHAVSNMLRLSFLYPHWIHQQTGLCAKQEQGVDSEPRSAPAYIYYISLTKI